MSTSSEIVWWHFSDLHWEVGRFTARSQFLTELFKDLRNRLTLHGTPDFIVFSGDISFSGEHAQFEDAKKYFFDPLLEICAPQQIPIFVVAGNHDLSRKQARLLNPEMITSIKSVQALNEFLDDEDSRRSVMTPLGGFKQFFQLLNSEIKDEEDVLAWSHEFSVRDQPIYIAGVNTSWASSYNRDLSGKISDERNLLLGQWQFNHLQPQSKEVVLSLLIMHHPSTSLLGVVEHQANSYMQQHFDFVLFGHTHTVRDLSQRLSPAGECIYLPSPAIYSGLVDSLEFARGYNIVTYNPKEKKGQAYYYRYSEIMGAQFKPFIDLYPNGQSYYPLELQTPNPPLPHHEIFRSYEDVINSSPNLQHISNALQKFIRKQRKQQYDHNSIELYDNLALEFVEKHGQVEQSNKEAIWEAFVLCRTFLLCELTEFFGDPRGFNMHKAKTIFEEFLRMLTDNLSHNLCIDSASYFRLASLGLEDISLISEYKSIPENYMRYFAAFWVFNLTAFYFNYPKVASLVLQGDPRISDIRIDPEDATNINVIAGTYDKSGSQLMLKLRTHNKEGFLAVTTIQHYIDHWIKEVAEYWRHHHLMYPALVLRLEYPLWNQKDISGNYLAVEATPIIRLLMGRAFYRGVSNIWFRELLQNALDANSTRTALASSDYASKILIHYDGQNICSIQDNGIGMSFQHIIRYLTTLGRSIWVSDELETKSQKQKPQHTIGKFGIGFASVFQDAERIFVRTRFFRAIDEAGWEIDFTSVDKPFFVERHPFSIGTQVEVILKNTLSADEFTKLVKDFFLYITDNVEISPSVNIAKCLEDVRLLTQRHLKRSKYVDTILGHNIQGNSFSLRTLFCYSYDKENAQDKLPGSFLQIGNAGVKVFDQSTSRLKPGKHYVWINEETEKSSTYSYNDEEVLNYFWIILDFQRGYSPILPSRVEIEINQEFSNALLDIIFEKFCDGLEQVIREIDATDTALKSRRKLILSCLMDPIRPPKNRGWRRGEPPLKFCNVSVIQSKAIELYALYCPLRKQFLNGDERIIAPYNIDRESGGLYVLESLTKTDLFKVYVRALGIQEWITVDNDREFFLLKMSMQSDKWQGIYTDRDIYKDGQQLFTERVDSSLTQFIRGDYAVVDSDIFGNNAFVVLPGNLPNFWKRGEAASYRRSKVNKDCPARVLLNIQHKLFATLDKHASVIPDMHAEQIFKFALDNLADGVIEQDRITFANARWKALRAELSDITKEILADISYESLRGKQ